MTRFKTKNNRLVDIICDKMSEQGEAEQVQPSKTPNTRGGPSNGATRLNEATSNDKSNGLDGQSCQC